MKTINMDILRAKKDHTSYCKPDNPELMTTNPKTTPAIQRSSGNERRKSRWQEAARRQLKAQMELHGYGYKQLARALNEGDSDAALITRINRGTFSAAFFLQALSVMGTKSIDVSYLSGMAPAAGRSPKS